MKIFTRFHKNIPNTSTKSVQNSSKIFYKFPTFLKVWANNSKFVLQNLPDEHIFPKIFKIFLKLLFYNFSRLFQNFLIIISCFSDNFSQVFPKIDAKMSRNFLLECPKICTKHSPLSSKFFDTYRYFKNIEKWIDIFDTTITDILL